MNSSIYGADRATHLRIVAVALAGSIAVMALSLTASLGSFVNTPTTVETGKHYGLDPSAKGAATTRPPTRRI